MTCDCWISICFVCFCVSRFVACDCNIMTDRSENCNCESSFFHKNDCLFRWNQLGIFWAYFLSVGLSYVNSLILIVNPL